MSVNEIRNLPTPLPTLLKNPKSGPKTKSPTEPAEQNAAPGKQEELLTPDEKQYFARLFPQAAGDIQSYQVYSPGGKRTIVQSGTIIDRRG